MTKQFSKTEAIKRVRLVMQEEKWKTAGKRVEISDLDGRTDRLNEMHKTPKFLQHNAEFRVLLSTVGAWGELQDMFRMNIGDDHTPPRVCRS